MIDDYHKVISFCQVLNYPIEVQSPFLNYVMKEKILKKIKDIQPVLDDIYDLRRELTPNERFYDLDDVLGFVNYVKNTHIDKYNEDTGYDLDYYYRVLDSLRRTYKEVFGYSPGSIDYASNLLNVGIPVEKMITDLYDYLVAIKEDESPFLKDILNKLNSLQDIDSKITDVHGALFKKEKTKKDKNEIIEAGIRLRLLKSKR